MPPSPPSPPSQTLFIWDFDNTIVLDNTDTLVFARLGPHILAEHRAAIRDIPAPLPWTKLIGTGLRALHHAGVPAHRILAAAAEAPLPTPTAAALRAVSAAEPRARSAILSDANSLFIAACLRKAGLPADEVFRGGVHTNPAAEDVDGCICVRPYVPEDEPGRAHACVACAANLCKGEVVDGWREGEYAGWRMVYVGDGRNDYCPVKRLQAGDAALVRKGFALHKMCERGRGGGEVRAEVMVWETAEELKELVLRFL